MKKNITGSEVRRDFIEYFKERNHTFVPSSSLVPGGDQTLLFTNAGMVQFKDVFLGTENRPYNRAVNSQKCMRVSGKHNDLDDVGRDNYHHTFFEMLGNWSFGDYYKKEAISWAWELLTNVWGIDKDKLWVTCFKDEKGEIPTDLEAYENWKSQPGIKPSQIVYFGRKDNFWEMAENGPCGPCSEIHIDRGVDHCDRGEDPTHICGVNGDCHRFLELWNLVFIQYNRMSPTNLAPLPACHVDTGMGFERIVAVLQDVDSNYRTDLLLPLMDVVMKICKHSEAERENFFTPYRVIADHCRAASFLIADGVVPGNVGRNYICRMIIRRAARFGSKIGLEKPFLGQVARKVIEIYGGAYPEIKKNEKTIVDNLTREEKKFKSTVEGGLAILDTLIESMKNEKIKELKGELAFDLYATHGLPLEITKDVLVESGYRVDQDGFFNAMETHRQNSGAGKEFGPLGGEDSEFYGDIAKNLIEKEILEKSGVENDPYSSLNITTALISIIKANNEVSEIVEGEKAEIILKATNFYIESGGQVSDVGFLKTIDGKNIFSVESVRKPAPGIVIHCGEVVSGKMRVGDTVLSEVDKPRRQDIMRNHTATHLLQSKLKTILGGHVRQAGSLVTPNRLRFDFTHPEPVSLHQIQLIEKQINAEILNNSKVSISQKKLDQALREGATALFGEKYGDDVRTISIGGEEPFSFELCGGTHVSETSEIGTFIIMSEGSAAAGVRRIEAVTGRAAYRLIEDRFSILQKLTETLQCANNEIFSAVNKALDEKTNLEKQFVDLEKEKVLAAYKIAAKSVIIKDDISILGMQFENTQLNIIREVADIFRKDFQNGIAILSNINDSKKIQLIIAISDSVVKKGFHAGNIAKSIANEIGGSGGGRPQLAQAGGKDVEKIKGIFAKISDYVKK
jgi:alanyl-tRNA synthetase